MQRVLRHSKPHVTKERYIKVFDRTVVEAVEKMQARIEELRQAKGSRQQLELEFGDDFGQPMTAAASPSRSEVACAFVRLVATRDIRLSHARTIQMKVQVVRPQPRVDQKSSWALYFSRSVKGLGAEIIDLSDIPFRDFELSACSIEFEQFR